MRKIRENVLLTFTVKNFRSFREEQTLDLRATKEKPAYSWLESNVAKQDQGEPILKTKAIYGANASGKSNLIRAIFTWHTIAQDSATNHNLLSWVSPFVLDPRCRDYPTELKAVFTFGGKTFEYALAIRNGVIEKEWLYNLTKRKALVFERIYQEVIVNKTIFKSDDRLSFLLDQESDLFNSNVSFFSAANLLKINPLLLSIKQYFHSILIVPDDSFPEIEHTSLKVLAEQFDIRAKTLNILQEMDIDLADLLVVDRDNKDYLDKNPSLEPFMVATDDKYIAISMRPLQDNTSDMMAWPSKTGESAGTNKLLHLVPAVVMILEGSGTLLIDEFESQLHTKLSREIVQLFNSKTGNPNNAQFIFSTHDTNLLDNKLLRRDQVALVEKNERGASEVYSLSDVKGVRKEDNFERDYLGGSYGAVPNVRELDIDLEAHPDGE